MYIQRRMWILRGVTILLFAAILIMWRIAWTFPREMAAPTAPPWKYAMRPIDVYWSNGCITVTAQATGLTVKYPEERFPVGDGGFAYWNGGGTSSHIGGFQVGEQWIRGFRGSPVTEWRFVRFPVWPFAWASGGMVWWVWRRTRAIAPENAFPVETPGQRNSDE